MVESSNTSLSRNNPNLIMEKAGKIFYSPPANIIFLVLLTCAVYWGSLNVPFMWDDEGLILRDEQIRSLNNIPRFFNLTYLEEDAAVTFRPLRTVSFAIDYFLWEYNPYGYHLTNLFFHIFNVLLIYFFVHLLLQQSAISNQQSATDHSSLIPLFSALLFAAHPIHTEAVVWIKNRSELFSTFFFLSSLILFIKSQTQVHSSQFTPFRDSSLTGFTYLLSLVCFILSLLSKEVAMALPLILIFYSFFFLLPAHLSLLKKGKKIFLKTLPFLVIGILYAVLRFTLIKRDFLPTELARTLDLSSRILLVIKTIGEYLKLLLFPVNLSAEHSLEIPKSILELDVLIFTGAIIFLLISAALLFRRANPVSLIFASALLWIFFTLFQVGNIYYLHPCPLAEQRLYLPSVGFCILLALLIAKGAELTQRAQKISLKSRSYRGVGQLFGVLAVAGILAFYSVGTIKRITDWQDPLRFWEKTAQSNPSHWRPRVNLGYAYLYANRIEEGIQRFKLALSLAPEATGIYFALGFAYEKQGKIEEATAMFEKGISFATSDIDKADLPSHLKVVLPEMREIDLKDTEFLWGYFYQMRGLKEKAIEYYKKALVHNPAHSKTHYNLAQIYDNEGQYNQAMFHYEQVIKSEPEHWGIDKVYFNLGKIYRLRGEQDKALTYWKKAVEIKPAFLEARMSLAELYKERGMYSEAIAQYKKAAEIVPKNWNVYFNLGLLYTKQGLSKEAAEYYEKAVKCNPNFAEAHYNLGLLYLKFGRFNEAAKLFQRIIYLDPTNMRAKKMYEVALESAKQGKLSISVTK